METKAVDLNIHHRSDSDICEPPSASTSRSNRSLAPRRTRSRAKEWEIQADEIDKGYSPVTSPSSIREIWSSFWPGSFPFVPPPWVPPPPRAREQQRPQLLRPFIAAPILRRQLTAGSRHPPCLLVRRSRSELAGLVAGPAASFIGGDTITSSPAGDGIPSLNPLPYLPEIPWFVPLEESSPRGVLKGRSQPLLSVPTTEDDPRNLSGHVTGRVSLPRTPRRVFLEIKQWRLPHTQRHSKRGLVGKRRAPHVLGTNPPVPVFGPHRQDPTSPSIRPPPAPVGPTSIFVRSRDPRAARVGERMSELGSRRRIKGMEREGFLWVSRERE